MYSNLGVLGVWIALYSISAVALQTQFVDRTSGLGFAVASVQNQSSTDVSFQISAPTSAGWGAVGTGDRMDGSLMFIILPSGSNAATVSIRTAHGHDTPNEISGSNILVQSSQIISGVMTANVVCYNCTDWTGGKGINIQSSTQPWIWAIGPGQGQGGGGGGKRDGGQGAEIEKHSKYGTFFVDMPKTLSMTAVKPTISGVLNINTKALPSSVPVLVIIHAICLGGAFVLIFPLGIVILRWFGSVRFHWILQIFASFVSVIGLVVAIVLSIEDPEYKGLDEGHQIIGIFVVAALFLQAALGYMHHAKYKRQQRRTWASHAHSWTGRAVIIVGMLNAVLGFVLAGQTLAAAGVGAVSVLILVGIAATTYFGTRRLRSKSASQQQHFDHVPLGSYENSYNNSPQGGSEQAFAHYGGR